MTPPEILAFREPGTRSDAPGWQVRVVPNKYPAVLEKGDLWRRTNHLYASQNGVGSHEVIIENPEHCINIAELNERQFHAILRAYRDRLAHLQNDPRWHHVLIFKNQGVLAGATLEHVHSQLIALPMVPREVFDEWQAVKEYHGRRRRCLYCDMIDEERLRGCRVVTANDGFVVCCPFAPRFPFETWIFPRKHEAFFSSTSDIELAQLGNSLRETLARLNAALNHPAFNYVLHSAPLHELQSERYHWHLEIMPKTIEPAGFEWGSGFYMNSVAPEDAARDLRDVIG